VRATILVPCKLSPSSVFRTWASRDSSPSAALASRVVEAQHCTVADFNLLTDISGESDDKSNGSRHSGRFRVADCPHASKWLADKLGRAAANYDQGRLGLPDVRVSSRAVARFGEKRTCAVQLTSPRVHTLRHALLDFLQHGHSSNGGRHVTCIRSSSHHGSRTRGPRDDGFRQGCFLLDARNRASPVGIDECDSS
jgi:hypothetical protein